MSLILKNYSSLAKDELVSKYGDLYSQINADIDYIISFSNSYQNYAVGIVDIVDSTHIAATLNNGRACKYYSIFLNSMATVIRRFGGKVVKNVGDSLLYYFPKTSCHDNKQAFADILDCGAAMIEARGIINKKLFESRLPPLNYRVSADYGSVMVAHSANSYEEDLFGSPINMCAKINKCAPPNGMVIGYDLYQVIKSSGKYNFREIQGCSVGFKNKYPVFLTYPP
jgi:class 3 adenylate cyclase